ncbi:hypothetical protein [Streptomyces viridochromogenes]|uniref:hypothetical protein n=1 Tax=Streptomyces viridochromogenes TaxID=1938 RepID=UPI00069EAC5A|nr:hypothetical protein [Streptomyces viridochromogenes]KOG21995.1 hypothetical protein ADK36_13725 [Streptomyces viridochromogenes]
MPENTDETTPQTGTEETHTPGTGEGAPQGTGPTGDGDGTAGGSDTPEGTDALGDAGKKALDSMKGKWHSERDRRRELEAELETLRAPKPSGDNDQPDPEAIRREATREATKAANTRILRSEIKAAAAGKLADPTDALAYLDLSSFEVDENGDVDADEVRDAIDDLLTRKPYLAATGRPRFQGSGDGGAQRKAEGPSQLTREDLKRMGPAEIHQAKRDGRLNKVLGISQ